MELRPKKKLKRPAAGPVVPVLSRAPALLEDELVPMEEEMLKDAVYMCMDPVEERRGVTVWYRRKVSAQGKYIWQLKETNCAGRAIIQVTSKQVRDDDHAQQAMSVLKKLHDRGVSEADLRRVKAGALRLKLRWR